MSTRPPRYVKEFRLFHAKLDDPSVVLELAKEDDFSHWVVRFPASKDTPLEEDLERAKTVYGIDHICAHLVFPENYPVFPPLVYIEYPTLKPTSGWSMFNGVPCWEIVGSGWEATFMSWSLVLQLKVMLSSSSRVDFSNTVLNFVSLETARAAKAKVLTYHPEWKITKK